MKWILTLLFTLFHKIYPFLPQIALSKLIDSPSPFTWPWRLHLTNHTQSTNHGALLHSFTTFPPQSVFQKLLAEMAINYSYTFSEPINNRRLGNSWCTGPIITCTALLQRNQSVSLTFYKTVSSASGNIKRPALCNFNLLLMSQIVTARHKYL